MQSLLRVAEQNGSLHRPVDTKGHFSGNLRRLNTAVILQHFADKVLIFRNIPLIGSKAGLALSGSTLAVYRKFLLKSALRHGGCCEPQQLFCSHKINEARKLSLANKDVCSGDKEIEADR